MAMPSSTNPAINDHRAGQRRPPSDLPWTAITRRRPARTEIHPDHEAPVHLQQSKLQRKIQLQIHSCRRQQASARRPPTAAWRGGRSALSRAPSHGTRPSSTDQPHLHRPFLPSGQQPSVNPSTPMASRHSSIAHRLQQTTHHHACSHDPAVRPIFHPLRSNCHRSDHGQHAQHLTSSRRPSCLHQPVVSSQKSATTNRPQIGFSSDPTPIQRPWSRSQAADAPPSDLPLPITAKPTGQQVCRSPKSKHDPSMVPNPATSIPSSFRRQTSPASAGDGSATIGPPHRIHQAISKSESCCWAALHPATI
ncbi:hypothetical protein ACLOJK_005100 [Asimina triloba]